MRSRWIVRLSDIGKEGSLDAFSRRFAGLDAADGAEGEIWLDDPDYGRVVCRQDGVVLAEGRVIDPSTWAHAGQLLRLPKGDPVTLPSHEMRNLAEAAGEGGDNEHKYRRIP
jgi:hypothetical protein